jgi:hypothetical protein
MLMNAERGAWSMLLIMLRPMRKKTVRPRFGAAGRAPRKREEGRCVTTMAGMRPRRREREAEKILPNVERNLGMLVSNRGHFWLRNEREGIEKSLGDDDSYQQDAEAACGKGGAT